MRSNKNVRATKDGSDLSPRQSAILNFIIDTISERGYPPTVREIADVVDLKSPASVHSQLETLEHRGYIRRDPDRPRAMEVRWERDTGVIEDKPAVRNLPVYGRIAAGPAALAQQSYDEVLPVPGDFITDEPHFALIVKGDSMVDAGILNGDYVVIKATQSAHSGDIVAAMMDGVTGEGEATIKTLSRRGAEVTLVPQNRTMTPIPASDDLRVLGKAVAVLRKL